MMAKMVWPSQGIACGNVVLAHRRCCSTFLDYIEAIYTASRINRPIFESILHYFHQINFLEFSILFQDISSRDDDTSEPYVNPHLQVSTGIAKIFSVMFLICAVVMPRLVLRNIAKAQPYNHCQILFLLTRARKFSMDIFYSFIH